MSADDDNISTGPLLDRSLFSSVNFSVEAFANNIANKILFVPLLRLKNKQKPLRPTDTARSEPPLDFRVIAGALVHTFESYEQGLSSLIQQEQLGFAIAEGNCRSIEHMEKSMLSKVRVGLDATTARLRDFEDKITNAMASTVGIQQHLTQSNARVQRGKAVSTLLRHFETFTKISPAELNTSLKGLSKGRSEQRHKKVQDWADFGVSHIHPNFFGDSSEGNAGGDGDASSDEEDEEKEEEDDGDDGAGKTRGRPTHRAESAAIAQGLHRLFALRNSTPVAASWILRLASLARELTQVVATAANVEVYLNWLQKELIEDLNFLIAEFRKFYNDSPQTSTTSAFGKALLKSMEHVMKLSSMLSQTTDVITKTFYNESAKQTADDLRSKCSIKPLPPLAKLPLGETTTTSAMPHFINVNKRIIEASVNYVSELIDREAILVEIIFAQASTARQQLLSQIMEKVIKPYVIETLKESKEFEAKTKEEEGRLSPRSRWRCAERVGDAMSYHLSLTTELYKFCTCLVNQLAERFGHVEVDFLRASCNNLFDFRESYTKQRTEIELLKRMYRFTSDRYTRAFAAPLEGPYELREEHGAKAKDIIVQMAAAIDRIQIFSLLSDMPAYLLQAITITIEELQQFFEQELVKTMTSVQSGIAQAFRPCAMLEEYIKPRLTEAHIGALQILLFVQTEMMKLNLHLSKICALILPMAPTILSDVDSIKIKCFQKVDDDAEMIVGLCCQCIVIRALTILANVQEKSDYCPVAPKAGKKSSAPVESSVSGAASNTSTACALFCRYLDTNLESAAAFIQMSCGQNLQVQTSGSSAADAGGADSGINKSRLTGPTPAVAKAKSMSLKQLMFGDGQSSVVRLIGVSLYRGVVAHVRQFTVNDEGALRYKQDMSAYYVAIHPLTATNGLDSAVVDRLFCILKETSNLYFMPLENLKAVKENGLLTVMSTEEQNTFIQTRFDVKEARKLGVWK